MKTTRDMVLTMGVVAAVVILIALYGSHLSFGGLTPKSGPVPTADVTRTFTDARGVLTTFAITVPHDVPADWHPNSASVTDPTIDGPTAIPTVRGGWILPDGTFITLIESAGSLAQVLVGEVGAAGADNGTVEAGGATWTKTSGVRTEVAWVRTQGRTTFLITGNAGPTAFVALAQSVAG
jgi:hypothetical protein